MNTRIHNKFLTRGMVNDEMMRRGNFRLKNREESFLREFVPEIKTFLKKEKEISAYIEEDDIIERLNHDYSEKRNEKFDTYLKGLIKEKYFIMEEQRRSYQFIQKLDEMKERYQFPAILRERDGRELISSIFPVDDFATNKQTNQIRILTKMVKAEYFEEKKRQESILYMLANTLFFPRMNLMEPTIGNLFISTTLHTSLPHLMMRICNMETTLSESIPLHQQGIKDDLTAMVLKRGSSNYDFKKRVMESTIENIEISYDEIMRDKNRMKKIYMIPYNKIEVVEGDESSNRRRHEFVYDKYMMKMSWREVIKHNLDLLNDVLEMVRENPKNLNVANAKEVLALFLYFAISLFYEVYQQYLMKLNNILSEYQEDSRFDEDNLDSAVQYVDRLMDSLRMWKRILLNNFYDLFLPSRLTRSYGIKLDENGYVICSSKLVVDNEFLIKKYPFWTQEVGSNKLVVDKESLDRLNHFFIGKRRTEDVVNREMKLSVGFYLPNEGKMKDLIRFYQKYVRVINYQYTFDLFMIEKLNQIFREKIPIEIFDGTMEKINKLLTNSANLANSNKKTKNTIVIECYRNLVKAYQIVKVMKGKTYNKEKEKDMKERDENILLSSYYYSSARIIYELVSQTSRLSPEIRRYLLENMDRAFQKIESKL